MFLLVREVSLLSFVLPICFAFLSLFWLSDMLQLCFPSQRVCNNQRKKINAIRFMTTNTILNFCVVIGSDVQIKLYEPLVSFVDLARWCLGLKNKSQGMAIQCAFNPLLNRERPLLSSENKENAS